MTEKEAEPVFLELGKTFEQFFLGYVSDVLHGESVSEIAAPALYSLKAGGKRVRPALVLLCADLTPALISDNARGREGLLTAAAVECIHTYSLIHDDLPAMDDDDLRRGMPSCHKRYPEWAALLAGDTLNTFAFRLLADAGGNVAAKLPLLADAAGHAGMAAGQALDLAREKNDFPKNEASSSYSLPDVSEALFDLIQDVWKAESGSELLAIHMRKTGALIRCSCQLGALCNETSPELFAGFGMGLGLLFQITDDILDVTGQAERLGKTAGKDERTGKLTFPALLGLSESKELARAMAELLADEAETLPLSDVSRQALRSLVHYVFSRDH